MAVIVGRHELEKEICDALGLKHCRKLDIHFAVDEIATVTAEFFPEVDGVKQFPAILKKFRLEPIDDKKPDEEHFFHTGGVIRNRPLAPDEVPAILEKGDKA
jgi:hypothetical protein